MQKFTRILAAFALLSVLVMPAFAAKTNPLVVRSGTVQATVNGVAKTFSAGEEIPEGAVLTVTADVVIVSGGMSIEAKSGTTLQAARTDDGKIDVRANGGGSVTTKGFGNTAVIPVGGEANVAPNKIQAIKGSIAVTSARRFGPAVTQTLTAGQETTTARVSGNLTNISGTGSTNVVTILPPPPTQEQTVVSGSTPS